VIVFMYSNHACEHQAISCISSLLPRITSDVRIVYFTIGFISKVTAPQIVKIPIPERDYPTFHYYKAELSLDVMNLFPEEDHFFFTDTDILFSRRANLTTLKCDTPYPQAVFGPHEQPYIWERQDGQMHIYDEKLLMQYFNVQNRTVNYQWSCFYAFHRNSHEFFEEYTSMCKNEYLLKRRKWYYPFHDETSFNICLWKHKADQSLGHIFVNTHRLDVVTLVEENNIKTRRLGQNLDELGGDWEYIHDSTKVAFYHGFKEQNVTQRTLSYLLEYL
jgi:hypothetical protein